MALDYKTVGTEPQEWEQSSNPDKSFGNLTRSVRILNRGLAVGVDRFQRGAKVDVSRAQGIQQADVYQMISEQKKELRSLNYHVDRCISFGLLNHVKLNVKSVEEIKQRKAEEKKKQEL